jgi:hypothetical protein
MSSVLKFQKEQTSLRRQFTVFPYYSGGQNQFFTASNNTLYRIDADISNCDWVIARDMGKEMSITSVDPSIVDNWNIALSNNIGSPDFGGINGVVKSGSARKFQVLSMYSGIGGGSNLSDLYYTNQAGNDSVNQAGNATAYSDTKNNNNLFYIEGGDAKINDLLIVGGATTTTTSQTQSLPFGTFWAVNDPVVMSYQYSGTPVLRTIKNNINETTFFG